jgi:hypothetical protein
MLPGPLYTADAGIAIAAGVTNAGVAGGAAGVTNAGVAGVAGVAGGAVAAGAAGITMSP